MKSYIPNATELPFQSDEFREAFYGYLEMRIAIKKPLTTKYAMNLVVNKLKAVSEKTAIKALEKSIENNWTSVYPDQEMYNNAADRQRQAQERTRRLSS
jgi:hypothetical protein